ncbi:MAG: hypothetical protein DCC75_06840, partial [Proteobacteria bacterium]
MGNLAVEQRPAPKPDIRALMAEIRAKLRSDIENNRDKQPDLKTYDAHPNQQASVRAGDLFYSEELRFMNLNHDYASKLRLDGITSHRRGVIGRMLVKAKQKF